jgi:hypothetical protein
VRRRGCRPAHLTYRRLPASCARPDLSGARFSCNQVKFHSDKKGRLRTFARGVYAFAVGPSLLVFAIGAQAGPSASPLPGGFAVSQSRSRSFPKEASTVLAPRYQLGQLRNIGSNPPRLVFGEQLSFAVQARSRNALLPFFPNCSPRAAKCLRPSPAIPQLSRVKCRSARGPDIAVSFLLAD